MRDALTYLDQCYAMADTEITLDNVNETLGLISDESLDEIISAIAAKDKAACGRAVTKAFQSGLAANAIAEALITRLRDIEFERLDGDGKNFAEYDRIIDAVRLATGEMYSSGIPDIILEMTLMKLAAPAQIFVAPTAPVQAPLPAENLDAGRKIFYDIASFLSGEDKSLSSLLEKSIVVSFAGDTLTLGFKGEGVAGLFKNKMRQFEQVAEQIAGRAIKISVVVDPNLPPPVLNSMPEPARSYLAGVMQVFNASDATKIND